MDKRDWVQQLVPLVKRLKSFRVTPLNNGEDNLMLAVLKYLESKMDKASLKRVRTVQQLAHDPE